MQFKFLDQEKKDVLFQVTGCQLTLAGEYVLGGDEEVLDYKNSVGGSVTPVDSGRMLSQVFIQTDLPPSRSGNGYLELITTGSINRLFFAVQKLFGGVPDLLKVKMSVEEMEEDRQLASEANEKRVPFNSISFEPTNAQVIQTKGFDDQVLIHSEFPSFTRGEGHMVFIFFADEGTGVDYCRDTLGFYPEIVFYNPSKEKAVWRR